jgi:uncharacterized protein (TIGR03032 family)
VISTYQAGKVAMVGWDGRQVTLLMRDFDKPMGMAVDGLRLTLATRHEVWQFANSRVLAHEYLDGQPGRYDGLYLPRIRHWVGDVNVHDLAYESQGLMIVNTRFCCLSRLSADFSFEPVWRPPFVTDLVPEDRCHLNGLALRDGKAKYVTALGTTDTAGGWRPNKATGGIVMDVDSNEIIVRGLSMPHSPRWYNNQLWLLNSGAGELMLADPSSGKTTGVCGLPGYLRGLCFVGPYAVIGLSKIREKHIFGGLPVQEKHKQLHCGVAVVDLRNGVPVGMFEFTSGCSELYDVQFVPGMRRPMVLNATSAAIKEAITNPESCYWLRASHEVKDAPAGQAADKEQGRLPADAPEEDSVGT